MGNPVAVPPFTARFSTTLFDGHALLTGDEDGILTVLDTRRSLRDQMRVIAPSHTPPARFRAHDNAIFDAVWMNNDTRVASASGDATVRVFDPETLFRTALCRGATASVKCVRPLSSSSETVLVSSGRDGAIRLHDIRIPSVYDPNVCREMFHRPVLEVHRAHAPSIAVQASPSKRRRISAPEPCASVTSIALIPGRDHMMFSAGAADGSIKLWDVRVGDSCRHSFKTDARMVESVTPSVEARLDAAQGKRRRHGIASIDLDVSGSKLLASSTDSSIYIYNTNQLNLGHSRVLRGHTATSFYVRASFSPCGRFVASGSADTKGYVWDLERVGEEGIRPMLQLDGHRGGEVSVVEWCKTDSFKMATCGDDTTTKVWTATGMTGWERGTKSNGFGEARLLEADVDDMDSGSSGSLNRTLRKMNSKRLRDTDIRSFFGNKYNNNIVNNNNHNHHMFKLSSFTNNITNSNINSSSFSSDEYGTTELN